MLDRHRAPIDGASSFSNITCAWVAEIASSSCWQVQELRRLPQQLLNCCCAACMLICILSAPACLCVLCCLLQLSMQHHSIHSMLSLCVCFTWCMNHSYCQLGYNIIYAIGPTPRMSTKVQDMDAALLSHSLSAISAHPVHWFVPYKCFHAMQRVHACRWHAVMSI